MPSKTCDAFKTYLWFKSRCQSSKFIDNINWTFINYEINCKSLIKSDSCFVEFSLVILPVFEFICLGINLGIVNIHG